LTRQASDQFSATK